MMLEESQFIILAGLPVWNNISVRTCNERNVAVIDPMQSMAWQPGDAHNGGTNLQRECTLQMINTDLLKYVILKYGIFNSLRNSMVE